jgi:ATP-dependent Clp protease protease subunit
MKLPWPPLRQHLVTSSKLRIPSSYSNNTREITPRERGHCFFRFHLQHVAGRLSPVVSLARFVQSFKKNKLNSYQRKRFFLYLCFIIFIGKNPTGFSLEFRKEKMNNDFRKYATRHLGMNGLVLDEVMAAQAQYLNPYILEERQLNVTQMDVFSRLMMDRIIFLGTAIDDYTANTLQAQLLYLDSVDNGKDISIYINSPGGSVTAGLGIYDTMQFISSDVATICTGMAASMGAVLLVAGAEGKRSALPHSRVMIHQPLGGVQGQASDIEIEAREIQKFKKELYTIISNHSHQSYDKVWQDSDRNYWMTAAEAKDYGMIDTVLTRKNQE